MSRGQFRSRNTVGETFSFQTNCSSGTTFDPSLTFLSGTDRVHWDFGDGSPYLGGNSVSKNYVDSGTTKTVTVNTNRLSKLNSLNLFNDNIVGHLDLSGWVNFGSSFYAGLNNGLTGITNPVSQQSITNYRIQSCNVTGLLDLSTLFNLGGYFSADNNSITNILHTSGSTNIFTYYSVPTNNLTHLDLSMITGMSGTFRAFNNPTLTAITHGISNNVITYYGANLCDLTGNHDMAMFTNLGGGFFINENSNLTGITHTYSPQTFTQYYAQQCDITGEHDLSMFPNLGGIFLMYGNTNMTKIVHTATTTPFSSYNVSQSTPTFSSLSGNHDVSMLHNLGGSFILSNNGSLTGVTHTYTPEIFSSYQINRCDITGEHDLTMIPNLGGVFSMYVNDNLTRVLHTATTQTFNGYYLYECDNLLDIDVSMLSNLGGIFRSNLNPSLTGITFPITTQTFKNLSSASQLRAFNLSTSTSLGYVDFKPLSGINMDVTSIYGASIDLTNLGMSAAEVNQTLVEFSGITTNNLSGWSGLTGLYIGGTNATPDTTSGGYNGIAAINYLTGGTAQWVTIVTS